jgi:hypothetical protein
MSAAKQYRKKPVVIEAWEMTSHWSCDDQAVFFGWCKPARFNLNGVLVIETLEGDMTVSAGDFIIKGVNGEFYPCKSDVFWKSYEVVSE